MVQENEDSLLLSEGSLGLLVLTQGDVCFPESHLSLTLKLALEPLSALLELMAACFQVIAQLVSCADKVEITCTFFLFHQWLSRQPHPTCGLRALPRPQQLTQNLHGPA